jgi:hypothetical protein
MEKRYYFILIVLLIVFAATTFSYFSLGENNLKKLNCTNFSIDKCPNECTLCPPCEVCSSISCQTEEYCKNIGFNKSWWNSVKPPKK